MTLSDFIEASFDVLVDDWTAYARAVSPQDGHLNDTQLRDSARELLAGIAIDMREMQSREQQEAKSREPALPNSMFKNWTCAC
ncbi:MULTISPECIES: hypothetical protein [unclassified Caballeronia]|uniref:hypothetical protein n=1 Tax=unclassified Caballeronia TaxID=2646786 RepID=UPI002864899D|nr:MULTISPECIES: hypothetical protein [unclassified Caballeronia]MDR5777332.1 hypothetical protein [Caballeronia sp. LZ002]MDR5806398.1 hypothetical protein [Caballeronia sp. LZ001]MDR5852786.1 hypothetical protein [Caballeronia sp. LZ003]